ncbi:UDP-N-acetylmuramoylalanine--D-glutamate ligase [Herbaspirillum rubrisubalbicans]|uniref:UDP-N-acetylmuramoyl-L-alanine--D-glutamate ligase n=1 Tax=Herbaspirillum rubrisubalbicans TaxID=80842 RepID=UPI001559F2C1|nr:UDP-N-acetylmuramoyl-L-alanine--D-glutamate ligase [Herbaspirillum rubrisubalbicans]MCP1575681.1 UDP-N-acetylmuramoylalanine--D-glutamate ligase [Herbaspirillum rubrisubalbicans]NQE50462.1 UDP-N-acetylmuramoylalanine ligase [Herbaspirillum rubrisubalbicans]
MNYSGKHVLVLGLGESGLAMARWLVYCGASVRVADTRSEAALAERLAALRADAPEAQAVLGQPLAAALLDGIDFVAVSPGLAPEGELAPLLPVIAERGLPLWGEIELFAQALLALREETLYQPKILAITGTNGKTTVTRLTGLLCQRAGLSVQVAGNISPAALDVLREAVIKDQVFLAELAEQDALAAAQAQAEAEAQAAQQAVLDAQQAAEAEKHRRAAARIEEAAAIAVPVMAPQAAPSVPPELPEPQLDLLAPTADGQEPEDGQPATDAPADSAEAASQAQAEAGSEAVAEVGNAANEDFVTSTVEATLQVASDVVPQADPDAPATTGEAMNLGDFMEVSRKAEEDALVEVPPPPPPEPTYRGSMPQAWVLELSSFQLHTTHSLQAHAATVLNLTQDHLDWHGSMEHYAADKARIFGQDTVRVLNRDDALVMEMASSAAPLSTFGLDEPDTPNSFGLVNDNGMLWLANAFVHEDDEVPEGKRRRKQKDMLPPPVTVKRLMPADALKIRGAHNAMNALAALALCRAIDLPMAPLLHGLREYTGEPHRVELVGVIQEVEYYDDSKGTNVGATVAALNGLGLGGRPNRIVLIAGGDGKGQDFSPLDLPVQKYARAVLLIGRDAPAVRTALADSGVELIDCASLEQAVEQAGQIAKAGDIVLLSPACASLDMFRNYAHRAEVFVDAVHELALSRGEVLV